ncbi:TetR/AcrR family transcriptional regulator [Nocardioides currus]|uniref:TetR family transcriptional regulator n=1 Tax=Nocardioides currus TaxID=2133958 RepID=A0A2R7YZG4_9ACTN|nr:TetR/AcrR family transcriptional regulator [Nocardioides currus]PUA81289.1 TetR family transcriptional regulator [Nocardioides currus]
MSSLRNKDAARIASLASYLDAARDCLLDIGWRRTTLTEVARRAGVSRMTIYRAWSDMSQLLGDLMTREWSGIVAAGDPEAGIVDRVLDTVRALRSNELFVRIVELDPELLLPYLLNRRGRSQDLLLDLIEDAIRAGQADGSIRTGDPVVMARSLVLAAHGFVLSGHTMVDDEVSEEDLYDEARLVVTRVLAP